MHHAQAIANKDKAKESPAELILQLLLYTLKQPAPSFAHLLLGYDVGSGTDGRTSTLCHSLSLGLLVA